MNKLTSRILIGACVLTLGHAAGAVTAHSPESYKAALETAEADYDIARARCKELKGNPKDICVEAAKAARDSARAEAEASYDPSVHNMVDSRITRADGAYEVAKELCDAKTGNDKDVCMKEAEATHTGAVAHAKADEQAIEAHADARSETVDAEYDAAVERCDSYAGDRKNACVAGAKAQFGK